MANRFAELSQRLHQTYQQKVVVLVDEYDKPILDNIENPELAIAIREGLSLKVIAEDATNQGRIDLTVLLDKKVFIIEFKACSINIGGAIVNFYVSLEKNSYVPKSLPFTLTI